MLFWHIPRLRTAHSRVWDDLQYAWRATFHSELSDTVLEKWPTTGPHAFSADQAHWLTETLRHIKNLKPGPSLRRRVTPASPAPAPAQAAARKSKKSKNRRDPDPVEDTSRLAVFPIIIINLIISLISLISLIVFTQHLFCLCHVSGEQRRGYDEMFRRSPHFEQGLHTVHLDC